MVSPLILAPRLIFSLFILSPVRTVSSGRPRPNGFIRAGPSERFHPGGPVRTGSSGQALFFVTFSYQKKVTRKQLKQIATAL